MKNKAFKICINIVLIIISIAMLSVIGLNIYYKTYGKDKIPTAITSTYVTKITDPGTGEEHSAIEASYYANKNNKGYEVVELLFNSYSGISKQAVYSRGFQLVYDQEDGSPTLYYYDRYDGVSFETGHEYTFGDKMLIDINGDTYAIALDGTYTTRHSDFDGWKLTRSIMSLGLNFIFEDSNMHNTYEVEHHYTFEDLLVKIASIIKSSSNGTCESTIPLIDLGDFIHVYSVDDKGVPSIEPIGDNTLINSYFTMDTNYDLRGMTWSKQSMFKSVAYDSDFNISGLTDVTDYWKVNAQINLNESDFTPRSSAKGYFSLDVNKVAELREYDSVDIIINFNIDNITNVDVLGFDFYALYGLDIKELNIYSSIQCDFELLTDSILDTGLTIINTKNVNIINNSGVAL